MTQINVERPVTPEESRQFMRGVIVLLQVIVGLLVAALGLANIWYAVWVRR